MNGAGGAAGTLLGGIITEELSWRWVLLINLPIGIATAAVASVVVAERRRQSAAASFDLGGALAVTGGLLALVYGIVNAGSEGWTSASVLGPIALGLALLGLFVLIEGRLAPSPLVPLRVFASRSLRSANIVVLLFSAALFPMWFLTSLYLQKVLRMPPLGAGLAFLPMALTIMAFATRAGRLAARFGARIVLGSGLVLMTVGMTLFALLITTNGSYQADVLLPGLLVAVGIGLSIVPSTIVATTGVKPHEAGLASGLINTSRQMGGALGLAILASVAAQLTSHLITSDFQAPLTALTNGFRLAYLVGAIFAALAAVATFRLIPRGHMQAPAAPAAAAPGLANSAPAAQGAPPAAQAALAAEPLAQPAPPAQAASPAQPASPPLPDPPADSARSARGRRCSFSERGRGQPRREPAPARERVAGILFSVSGGGNWAVAAGSMTIQVAGSGERARRAL